MKRQIIISYLLIFLIVGILVMILPKCKSNYIPDQIPNAWRK
jgi:hypothetical protein